MDKKKIAFSGIQPSGRITLGNYLGALKNFAEMQDEYDCRFCVVDQHAVTVRQDPENLRSQAYQLFAQLLASGLDPDKCILFIQSHAPQHAVLAWVLNCFTMFGELSRMTQFKEKSRKHTDNINAGLFDYPVLMAADILIYNADVVPVGEDQRQHVELARDIAIRFNTAFPGTFVPPECITPKIGAKIMSLQEPTAKMSKSDTNDNAYVLVMDEPEVIMRKFKRAVTDSESTVAIGEGRDGVNNLISIYCAGTGKTPAVVEAEFAGRGYGDFKKAVGEATVELLRPVRERTLDLLKNTDHLDSLLKIGADKAQAIAQAKVNEVHEKLGFIMPK
ncbi:MAG TPA: tryptophan--tRNA ligase [Terriglobales bacterium]|nr:tryptophan--tRNA ligase [Terriglobales bacterium]